MSAEQSDNELVRELREKVQRLEERLADHESRLKSLEPSKLIPTAPLPPIPAPPPVQPVSMLETLARLSAEKEAKKEPPPSGPPTDEIRAAFAKNLAAIAKPPVVPPTKPAAPPTKPVAPPAKPVAQPAKPPSPPPLPRQHPGYPPPPRPGKSLESWIGKSWASWLGGILVLGAVLFFLKYAWDQGWINPTPLGRILLASAVGAAMVGLGQWLHFKHMRALAASLVGCGLAVLMGTMFAANIAFEQPVLSSGTTFTLVAIIGGAGIAFALQMRTMSLAILALLGMYLSPAILSTGSDQSPQFLAYLAVVTATGLGVSFFKRNWWAVRILTFVCGWFWLIVWTIQLGGSHSYLGTAACAGFFVLFLGELALSLHRVMTPPVDEMAPDRPPSPNTLRLESGAAVMAFINTTLAMTMFAILEATGAGLAPLWTLAMGLAGVMGILTFATPSRLFSLSAGIQAMALVIVAVPLYFTHSAITYAWATLGLALGIYARITNSRFARVWMFIMLLLVIARLWTFDAVNPGLNATLFSIGGESFTAWMLMSWGAALYALGLGWLSIREPVESQKTGNVLPMLLITFCALAGTLLSAAAAARGLLESVPSHAFTFTAAIWILVLIAWSNLALPKRYRLPGEIVALILLALTTIKWLLDGQTHDLKDRWVEGYGPPWSVFSMFTLNAGVLAAGVCLSQILRKTNLAVQVVWVTILALGVAARVLPLEDAFTLAAILWTLLLIGWSYLLRSPERRTTVSIVALVLLALISAKWLLIDGIVNTPSPFSFLSLFTLNAVLLAAGVCLSQVLRKLNLAVQVVWVTILAFVVAAKGLPLEDPFTLAVILWTLLLIGWSYLLRSPERRMAVSIVTLVLLVLISAKWIIIDGIVNAPSTFTLWSLFTLNGILLAAGVYLSQPLRQSAALRAWWITVLAIVIMVHWLPPGCQITLGVAVWSLALIAWSNLILPKEQRTAGETVALVLLAVMSIKWMAFDGMFGSVLDPIGYDGKPGVLMPFVNLFVLGGIVLAAGVYFSQLLRKRLESGPYLAAQLNGKQLALRAWWITILVFVALNVEAIRCIDYWPPQGVNVLILKNVTISVLWGILGLLGILIGFRRRLAPVRWVALTLLGITAAKVLLIDMANVNTPLRVLSFMVLGIVLLLVSFMYHKVGAIVELKKPEEGDPT